jgi:Dolichyl-phosphate-mannose-protein mannosyltransferase
MVHPDPAATLGGDGAMTDGPGRPGHARMLLVGVLAVAALLRLLSLPSTGIFGVDEGRYVLDAYCKYVELRLCTSILTAKADELAGGDELLLAEALPEAQSELQRNHPFLPKMGFSYLVALLWMLTGFSLTVSNGVEAVAGILTVGATFYLVRAVRNARAGIIAAAFLALAPYHIYFSRNSYPQCISGLLLVLAVWSHWAWWRRLDQPDDESAGGGHGAFALMCGVWAGLSFWFNYQVGAALPLLVVMHALICFRGVSIGQGLGRLVKGGLLVAAGFIAVIVAAEMVSYPMILAFRSQGLHYPHGTFLELLAPRFTSHSTLPFHPSGLVLFPYFLALFQGTPGAAAIAVLGLVGGWLAVRGRRPDAEPVHAQWVYLAVPFVVPVLMYSTKTTQGARMFVYILPFLAAMLGAIVDGAWREPGRSRQVLRVVVAVTLAIAAVSAAPRIAEVLRMRSAYPEVMAFAKAEAGQPPRAAWTSVVGAYTLECGMTVTANEDGPQFFVSDVQELYDGRYPDESPFLRTDAEPLKTFQHGFGRMLLESEVFPMFGSPFDNIRCVRGIDLERARTIGVYDLKATVKELPKPVGG